MGYGVKLPEIKRKFDLQLRSLKHQIQNFQFDSFQMLINSILRLETIRIKNPNFVLDK